MFSEFRNAKARFLATSPDHGKQAINILSRDDIDLAEQEITSWQGYQKTRLERLDNLASELDLGSIHYKDEGSRFGLGSFKALGGAYAVLLVLSRALSEQLGHRVTANEMWNGKYENLLKPLTVISATDGNHGRSVAWGAARLNARCRIYIHSKVSEFRAEALRELGAEVIRVEGNYDASVARTRADAEKHGWFVVSDTSWLGYRQPPLDVMAGYGLLAREIVKALPTPPSHVFLQGGVGGLAASVATVFLQEWKDRSPNVFVVEPELAPCLFESARKHQPTGVKVQSETIMAGLSCGEPSPVAWTVLDAMANGFMTIPDSVVAPAVRMLANGTATDKKIEAGESAVAGLCGLICAAVQTDLREKIGLNQTSSVILIGSEGITDPEVIERIMSGCN
ncbi:MAG: diaminopropionate ammonia-lyase [Roseibium sp.]|uniref:diaminopropionate ammonia-lyase n=1 Tax=Roseibium sp. TaxID=1936156 RepID=UPI002618CF74|nr:diaminopropionate ammonia-lyase [Roseibium sp.]MCV0423951.1 diaminopropionate ammonia-lyase [Roseibium sp.]